MSKIKVMIVEDEIIVAEDIKTSLQKMGYDVPAVVSSGEAAIKQAEETKPDLVLMDIVLRGKLNGIEAAGHIRSTYNIPVIYLTAYADDNILEQAKITEPFGYITKPFENRELHSNIEMALYKNKIEIKLKESREWLSTILSSIMDAIIATDGNGLIIFMNPVAEELVKRKQEEIKGELFDKVFIIVNEATGEKTADPVKTVLNTGTAYTLTDHLLIVDNNTSIPVEVNSSRMKDQDGNIKGVVVAMRNVTNKKRMEEDLNEKVTDLSNFYEMAIGRELKMKELKNEIMKLKSKINSENEIN